MKSKTLRSDFLLLLTSALWGFAFVAQLQGMEFVGPYLYNGVRFAIGSLSLIPLIFFMKSKREKSGKKLSNMNKKRIFIAGLIAGIILFAGASLQQVGLQYTTAGKAGFITGLYVVLVPLLGILLKHKTGLPTWIGAVIAVVGLYLISVNEAGTIGRGDLLVLFSSIGFACHVLLIDHYSKKIEPVLLASIQFAWCSIFSMATAIFSEPIVLGSILQSTLPILYGGIGSVGIAYTLQIVAQRDAPPAHSAIIMSLESVFAVVGGVLFLSEGMSLRGMVGCGLMLTGMILSQWELIYKKKV